MISIIIASVNQELLAGLEENIALTIGVDFEIIAIENSKGVKGICELYNDGALKAKYNLLCFMHEDLLIKTKNWGEIVVNLFNSNSGLGLIGVAGSQYKSVAPSSWYCYENEAPELLNFNIIQRYKYANKEKQLLYSNPHNEKFINVASIDGVWLCCTKMAIATYPFDEKLLKKFHGYDLDFSLGIGQKFEIGVTFDILIEHFSEGYTDKTWLEEILKVHTKWSFKLPIDTASLPDHKILLLEKRGFRSMMGRMRDEDFKFEEVKSMLMQSRKSRVIKWTLFLKLYLHLIKIFLKKSNQIS
ncbi:hypothetical protein EZ428_01835 [Pedobacter frigiditerrae]|uniref:Streptomycin biosynthesis protein StrF domain-containing protein n=1 Tax=Pedobacter frigiditerrae TaxID=2530452 RepID=A0A4V2MJA5_9SPHI|nr:glycosyltransferase [Pedobacter frigiditerrae]TCC93536.1 hypothetical protein EZ428_01835 [Pedobacter frigiditerrae]